MIYFQFLENKFFGLDFSFVVVTPFYLFDCIRQKLKNLYEQK